jgi:hypothetical protein
MIGGFGLFLDPDGRPRALRPVDADPDPGSEDTAALGELSPGSSLLLPLLFGVVGFGYCGAEPGSIVLGNCR